MPVLLNPDGTTNYTPDGLPPGPGLLPACVEAAGHDWVREGTALGGVANYRCTRCDDRCP